MRPFVYLSDLQLLAIERASKQIEMIADELVADKILKMSWTVYILECADGSLYTGITTDLTRRIAEHGAGKGEKGARYTSGRGPFRLVHQESHKNRAEASKREASIKAMTRAGKLALISKSSKQR